MLGTGTVVAIRTAAKPLQGPVKMTETGTVVAILTVTQPRGKPVADP